MANEESKNENPENQTPAEEEQPVEGLTAEEAADRAYNEKEIWDKNKKPLRIFIIVVAAVVGGKYFLNQSEQDEVSERSLRYLTASSETEGAEERFLAFSNDYDDELGGVAQYRAALIQYKDQRFEDAAQNFKEAKDTLGDNPLYGRAMLGYAVSLIKSESGLEEGKKVLVELADNEKALLADRWEAHFLLAVQALAENDEEGFAKRQASLSADENASSYFNRLVELKRMKKFSDIALSLPELNAEEGAKFLTENKEREGVVALESGLQYEVLTKGDDNASPEATDEVEVHYHGTLLNGEVFDSSVERGETSKFRLNGVIKGWTEALQLMSVGDKWKLFIPSDLAYGENGSSSIGPNETLIFEVELLGITPKEIPELLLDANGTDSNSSVADAPLVISDLDVNATESVVEDNATTPADGNGSE